MTHRRDALSAPCFSSSVVALQEARIGPRGPAPASSRPPSSLRWPRCPNSTFPATGLSSDIPFPFSVASGRAYLVSFNAVGQNKTGVSKGYEIAQSMRDFVQADNFYAALRFGLDCSPLRSVPSRPKPFGETKKFSACPLDTPVFFWRYQLTQSRASRTS